MIHKNKTEYIGFHKNFKFCSVKVHVKRMEKTTDWGKIFVGYLSNKRLKCRVYKELWKHNSKKKKWKKDMKRHFNEKEIQMVNKHMEICSTSKKHKLKPQ